MRCTLFPASARRMLRALLFLSVLFLASCAETQEPSFSLPDSPPLSPAFLPLDRLPAPPETWTLTGSLSFYLTLYDSVIDGPAPAEEHPAISVEDRDDRIITAVAADLVVQFYKEGTLTLNDTGEEFSVARSKDLLAIPPKNLELGKDPDGFPFLFTDVTLWVRDVLASEPAAACDWWPWWLSKGPEPFREKRVPEFPDGGLTLFGECDILLNEVKAAVQRERELEDLRQELSLIAYGEESVWDGEQGSHPAELRTYDLLLDIAGVGNVLGTGGFSSFFDQGAQGEQCDSEACPQCLLPAVDRCGNGGVSGAEQCDDGNRIPGDGCDAFCQVEGRYCGNLEVEPWEACDDGKECPDGMQCGSFADCYVGGKTCDSPDECAKTWSRICPDGAPCVSDNDDGCDGVKDACRYVFDGVCFAGGMVQSDRCSTHQECSALSQCGTNKLCTNLPFEKACTKDTDCAACSFEVVFGTCADSGERCNGNEDCPGSGYCILEPEGMCRPRTVGGVGARAESVCNAFCEDAPRCGDGITYLDEFQIVEQCDDGMHCADGTPCAHGEACADRSACQPRIPLDRAARSSPFCNEQCMMVVPLDGCGDGKMNEEEGEECDDGSRCDNGSACSTSYDCPTQNAYCSSDMERACTTFFDCPRGDTCLPKNDTSTCAPRSLDGCSASCEREYCGDGARQDGDLPTDLQEQCDPGEVCTTQPGGVDQCTNEPRPPVRTCTTNACAGGCTNRCLDITCGNGIVDDLGPDCSLSTLNDNEECDDGNIIDKDGCSSLCKIDVPLRSFCGDTIVDENGPDDIIGTPDDEECELLDPKQICIGGPKDGDSCTTGEDCAGYSYYQFNLLNGCVGQIDERCIQTHFFSCRTVYKDGCTGLDLLLGFLPMSNAGCKLPRAGNCAVEGAEQCDDGIAGGKDGCDNGTLEYCGDGEINQSPGIEECDKGDDMDGEFEGICCGDGSSCTTNSDCGEQGPCLIEEGQCNACRLTDDICPKPPPVCTPGQEPVCGDRCGPYGDGKEQCEDGNTEDGDGCSSECKLEYCGDKEVQSNFYRSRIFQNVVPGGEECDPGSRCVGGPNDGATCEQSFQCGGATCIPVARVCKGGTSDGADCSKDPSVCNTFPFFGGVPGTCVDAEEGRGVCDGGRDGPDGPVYKGAPCTVHPVCGGYPCAIIDDDPKCAASCQFIECGDCRVDPSQEQCDDGKGSERDNDGCSAADNGNGACQLEYCGDGVKQLGPLPTDLKEQCDDGGRCVNGAICETQDYDDCPEVSYICDPGGGACEDDAECGEGGTCIRVQSTCVQEACDICNNQCELIICGNGRKECGEECDDGNEVALDGCSPACLFEFCGDGKTDKDGPDNAPGKKNIDDDRNGKTDDLPEALFPGTDDEMCDEGWTNSNTLPNVCRTDCRMPLCGDGVVDSAYGEECDSPTCADGMPCTSHAECGERGEDWCIARSGDGQCSSECKVEKCGDGIVQPQYGEKCDDGNTESGDGCDATCQGEAAPFTVPLCGDGYREESEQCDDGNTEKSDGCDACLLTRIDLCGNGVVDRAVGEECDQGHPYHTLECTPYCRLPHPAALCGDGRKDPSGAARGNLLERLLLMSEGYQLDFTMPGSRKLLPKESAAGWYVTPRPAKENQTDPPFERNFVQEGLDPLDQRQCGLCGNGVLNAGEECDSGNRSGGFVPAPRGNVREWQRLIFASTFTRFGTAYYFQWADRLFPFGFHTFDVLSSFWSFPSGDPSAYVQYLKNTYGGFYWQYAYAAWNARDRRMDQTFVKAACSSSCTLELCGNDRIDPGETCEDDNGQRYGRAMSGDGCSATCALERGFRFGSGGICGDDVLNAGEQCDDGGRCFDAGNTVTGEYCRFDNVDPFRNFCPGPDRVSGTADDGTCKPLGKDGCSETCQLEPVAQCGNGVLEPYEDCDSGGVCAGTPSEQCFTQTTGGGTSCETVTVGGKQVLCPRNENLSCLTDADCGSSGPCLPLPGDGCGIDCRFETEALCGNGITEPQRGEACDPGSVCTGGPKNGESCSSNAAICGSGRCERVMTNPLCSSECDRVSGFCGNGVKEGAEQCDEGERNSNTEANSCRAGTPSGRPACVFAYCGDGILDRQEECDDGNITSQDGCTHCLVDFCGNGRLDAGETCDDGSTVSGDGCSEWCLLENICGNSALEGSEQCDDGNTGSGDGCSASCTFEYCGDAVLQSGLGEECDEGSRNGNTPGNCRLTCRLPVCGDAIKDTNEACDPAKHCVHDPMLSCADDFDCSLGFCAKPIGAVSGVCSADTTKICASDRECLLGECRVQGTPVCTATCTERPVCGDGTTHDGEQCDDGNTFAGDGCDGECRLERPALCGDGGKDRGEECDDGNTVNRDGCTETCQIEPLDCGGSCDNPAGRFVCGDDTPCQMGDSCLVGRCMLRSECVLLCTFGYCGNSRIDPGEQCDDGGRCMDDPSLTCFTHADCNVQTCLGEDASEGTLGTCSDTPLRPCMRDADCGSLCIPKGGDGCSGDCRSEGPLPPPGAFLTVCQEEGNSVTGNGGTPIGTAQVGVWQDTLLEPFRNRNLPAAGILGRSLADLLSKAPSPVWWNAGVSCASAHFPNALGNHVRAVSQCLEMLSRSRTIPIQKPVMPFQPVGITSYPACQEPKAALVAVMEMPAPVSIALRPFHPQELVASFERLICQESGFPRRSFLFLCNTASTIAPSPRSLLDLLPVNLQTGGNSSLRELMLAHALDAAYRASEAGLMEYLEEAIVALRISIETATAMFQELSRIQFTDTVCPIDGTALCPPSN